MIGMIWLMIAFVKDFSDDLLKLHIRRASHQNRWKLKVRFRNIIQLHSEVKQLSQKRKKPKSETNSEFFSLSFFFSSRLFDDFNAILEFQLLILFLWSIFALCSSSLVLQLQLVECIKIDRMVLLFVSILN